jgi:hypothetical protein
MSNAHRSTVAGATTIEHALEISPTYRVTLGVTPPRPEDACAITGALGSSGTHEVAWVCARDMCGLDSSPSSSLSQREKDARRLRPPPNPGDYSVSSGVSRDATYRGTVAPSLVSNCVCRSRT